MTSYCTFARRRIVHLNRIPSKSDHENNTKKMKLYDPTTVNLTKLAQQTKYRIAIDFNKSRYINVKFMPRTIDKYYNKDLITIILIN